MSKIMLVEDDTSLLEIYQARLEAEGFNIVTARDGEEALTVALKEHPDLIIADVMMPKVSGFDMVDILRSTPETKGTKIIMMTALNQAEDKARAKRLGADKYLVKSQVTLEDVTRVVHDVLAEQESAESEAISTATGSRPEQNNPAPNSPAAKPQATVEPVSVATEPSPAPSPAPIKITTPEPIDVKSAPAPAQSAPSTPKPVEPQKPLAVVPVAVAPEPKPAEESKPAISTSPKDDNIQPPKVTPISVTDDDSDDNDLKKESSTETKDPFLAQNPTLSDSANPSIDQPLEEDTPHLAEKISIEKPEQESKPEPKPVKETPKDNKVAEDAVKSLLTDDKKTDEPESSNDVDKSKYVSSNNDNADSKSLNHTKTIEPTAGIETETSTQLPDLAEIDATEAPGTPPAVNTVITPDPGSTPSTSE